MKKKILLTGPIAPYPRLPFNSSPTDGLEQRFSRGADIYTVISHTHCFANHMLAQNISWPAVCLEYPSMEDFKREVRKKYPYIGITCLPMHLDSVMEMCKVIRKESPESKIIMGSYGAMAFSAVYNEETRKEYVDYLCLGEGVRFLRELLGDSPLKEGESIKQRNFPKCGGRIPSISDHLHGNVAFAASGLGCIGGCDFCSTTTLFKKERIQLMTGKEVVEETKIHYNYDKNTLQMFVIEEDHFRQFEHLLEMGKAFHNDPELVRNVDIFTFGNVESITEFAEKYGWDTIAESGIGCIFIGVKSKFGKEQGYSKCSADDARTVFTELRRIGVRPLAAWMCGWDFHNRVNVMEDLHWLVSLKPTWQQLTRLSPFPGTPFWEKSREANRLIEGQWEDVHFWSGVHKFANFETHETLKIVEDGYRLMSETWGPPLARKLEVHMNGYEYCKNSKDPVMRGPKAEFHLKNAGILIMVVPSMDLYAPNGVVRKQLFKLKERYHDLFGPLTKLQSLLSAYFVQRTRRLKRRDFISPLARDIRMEPARKFIYDDNTKKNKLKPYKSKTLHTSIGWQAHKAKMAAFTLTATPLAIAVSQIGKMNGKSEIERMIDNELIRRVKAKNLTLAF